MNNPNINKTAKYFESIFTVANGGIVIVDQDCIILRVNPAFTKILGYEENEILGKPFYILTSKDKFKQESISHSPFNRFYASEKSSMEDRFYDKTGQDVPIRFRSVIIKDEQGQVVEAVGIIEQIAELTRTVELGSSLAGKMWEAQQNFENVLENTADAVLICDNSGNITMANNAFLQMLNYTQEEVVGKFIVNFTAVVEGTYATTSGEGVIIDEECVKNTGSKSAELYEKGYIKNWETYFVKKDKVHVPVEATLSALKDEGGERRGSIVILRDITERRKSEIENKKSRDFLENIFKTTADGILTTDNEGRISMVNTSIEKIFGYRKEELIGKSAGVLKPEGKKHQELAEEYLEILLGEGVVTSFECEYSKKDGSLINVEVNAALLKDIKGNITGSVASIRDISERKQAEEKIKETKDHLSNIIESSLDAIIVADSVGNVIRVNNAYLELLDLKEEEVIGKHMAEFSPLEKGIYESTTGDIVEIDQKFFNHINTNMTALFENGKAPHWETYLIQSDRKLIPVEENIVLLYNKDGTPMGSVGVIRDITERRKIEAALKASEEQHRSLIENAKDAIISTNAEGEIVSFNKTAEDMFGYTREEILGKSITLLSPPSERERQKKLLEQLKATKELYIVGKTMEGKGIKKDGQEFPYEGSPFTLELKGELFLTVILRDISERKEMQNKLLQSEKLKSLGELAGGVAHDFNNVLAAILGRAQLLKMELDPPSGIQEKRKSILELKKNVKIIESAARDGAETVRRIQEFARKRDDDKHFTTVDINELIDNSLEFTRAKWKDDAESKGTKINIHKELSQLPYIKGSAAELREVFTNLINNAVDAMPQEGDIKIKTFREGRHISITVEDTGCGISRTLKDKVFDPFFTTKGVQSTGLGMSVSYGIINRHQGNIKVDSVEGQGTTFTITLPISEKMISEEEKVETVPKEQRKARILIIEDEEEVRNVLAAILTKSDHEVDTAYDGNQGIEMFAKKEFDLVFTDLGMPGMSGWQVAEKVKSLNGRVPVAIITGWNIELDESEIKDKWVDLVIHKPFEVNQVLRLVQEGMVLRDRFKAA